MNNYTRSLQADLNNCGRTPMFEIEVQDEYGQIEWIYCDIFFKGNSVVAQRDVVSLAEQKSKYIASTRIVVDDCHGLDGHLQDLYQAVLNDIADGGIFELVQ
jgi:hypothetical protein